MGSCASVAVAVPPRHTTGEMNAQEGAKSAVQNRITAHPVKPDTSATLWPGVRHQSSQDATEQTLNIDKETAVASLPRSAVDMHSLPGKSCLIYLFGPYRAIRLGGALGRKKEKDSAVAAHGQKNADQPLPCSLTPSFRISRPTRRTTVA